jgi:cell division protein ZapA (FtsZ GTPase activity inhibitor)
MDQKSIRVRIYGGEYNLRVDDEILSRESADHIDKMMLDLHSKLPDQPASTLAILSALNVSEAFFQSERQNHEDLTNLTDEVVRIAKHLDDVINMK